MFRSILVAPLLSCAGLLSAELAAQTLSKTLVHSGLVRPVFVTTPAGDTDRLFIVEQGNTSSRVARIRISKNGSLLPTPFLDIDNLVANSGTERGLLGLAFHPDYWNNGYFYVNYAARNAATTIRRFQVSPPNSDTVNPATGVTLLTISQPFSNHNGGMIAFGPDGYLYIGMGDGGARFDPAGNAQNPNSLLGKILRIDVDNPAPGQNYGIPPTNPLVGKPGRDEIYHWGLRNPWRWSFDRATGDMYIGDVGQNEREEIDYVPAGEGGLNFGWRCLEATECTGLLRGEDDDPVALGHFQPRTLENSDIMVGRPSPHGRPTPDTSLLTSRVPCHETPFSRPDPLSRQRCSCPAHPFRRQVGW